VTFNSFSTLAVVYPATFVALPADDYMGFADDLTVVSKGHEELFTPVATHL